MRKIGVFVFLFLIALYTLFQARFLILGPQIHINELTDGATLASPVVTLSGTGRNIAYLSLNGRQIYTDQAGNWSEKLIAPQGLSIIDVHAKDRLGRQTEKQIRVVIN